VRGVAAHPAEMRAAAIARQIVALAAQPRFAVQDIAIVHTDRASAITGDGQDILTLFDADAATEDVDRHALCNQLTNYSSLAYKHGLILHTTVDIGYETPWRQIEALLLIAAERTAGLLRKPKPLVPNRALGSFSVPKSGGYAAPAASVGGGEGFLGTLDPPSRETLA